MKDFSDSLKCSTLFFEENGAKGIELTVTQPVQIVEGPQLLRFALSPALPVGALCLVTGYDAEGIMGDDGLCHDAEVRVSAGCVTGDLLEVRLYSYEDFVLAEGSHIAKIWLLEPYKEGK